MTPACRAGRHVRASYVSEVQPDTLTAARRRWREAKQQADDCKADYLARLADRSTPEDAIEQARQFWATAMIELVEANVALTALEDTQILKGWAGLDQAM